VASARFALARLGTTCGELMCTFQRDLATRSRK
jgi:hypothetical protein